MARLIEAEVGTRGISSKYPILSFFFLLTMS